MSTTSTSTTKTANQHVAATATSILTGESSDDSILNEVAQRLPDENHNEPRHPANNPSWWPTSHRRIPDYRQARYHPEWHELTDNSVIMPIVILVLFGGCHIISVGNLKKIWTGTD